MKIVATYEYLDADCTVVNDFEINFPTDLSPIEKEPIDENILRCIDDLFKMVSTRSGMKKAKIISTRVSL